MADFNGFRVQMVQGRTKMFRFRVKDASTGANVAIGSFSACRFIGKRSVGDPDSAAVFNKTLDNGLVKEDAPNGCIKGTLSPSDTASLPEGKDVLVKAEVQARDGDGNDWSLIRGEIEILAQVSEATP